MSATPKSTISLSSKKYSRGSLLPVEYDLERLIQNISNPHPSWKSSTPACEWRGIKCSDSFSEIRSSENAYEQQGTFQGTTHYGESAPKHKRTKAIQIVTSIAWGLYEIEMSHNPEGPLRWEFLPSTLLCFRLSGARLSGNVNLGVLPRGLQVFNVCNNDLDGPLDLPALPPSILHLDLSMNSFRGTVELTRLPSALLRLFLSENVLSGEVIFSSLPPQLSCLTVDQNSRLSGVIHTHQVPQSLNYIRYYESEVVFINDNDYKGDAL